jgi:hypothetical protein
MRGGFSLAIPSPAGGRGPGRGWARFTSPPPGARLGAGGIFFSFNLCPLCACHSGAPLFSPRSHTAQHGTGQIETSLPLSGLTNQRAASDRFASRRGDRALPRAGENRSRHGKKGPSRFGPGRKMETAAESLDGERKEPPRLRREKTAARQAAPRRRPARSFDADG